MSAPASGRVELDPDGTLTFVPEQPGLQRFTYQVVDDRGGSDTAQVAAFVNPTEGEPVQPVLQGLDDQQLARIAMACAGGDALEVERLEGQAITVPVPAPGERIEALAQPGQQITLRGGEFVSATYLIAEGGLLVLTDDGRMVYVADLVDAANSEQPPTLRVAGGPAVAATRCSRICSRSRSRQRARWSAGCRRPRPARSTGAAPISPRTTLAQSRPGRSPRGRAPTALGLGTPPVLENAQALFDGNGDADQGSAISARRWMRPAPSSARRYHGLAVRVGRPLPPALDEAARLPDAQINGVDQRNLTVGQSGDAAIVFGSEFAAFVNTLGVFLIRPNGEMVDPKIVFPEIEQAEPIRTSHTPRAAARSRQASRSCSAICTIRPSCTRDRNSVCS